MVDISKMAHTSPADAAKVMSWGDRKPSEAMGMTWGDKGCEYAPSKCEHEPDDGCMWCCMQCNTDMHRCPGCGTVADHKEVACDDCKEL